MLEFGFIEWVDEEFGVGVGGGDEGVVGEVVPVAVGEEEVGEGEVFLLDDGEKVVRGVVRDIDEGGGAGGVIDEEVGVGGGGAGGVGVDFHGGEYNAGWWRRGIFDVAGA